jgi:hypothetical protein
MTTVDLDSISEPEPTREEAKAILHQYLPDVMGSLRDLGAAEEDRDLNHARNLLSVACRTELDDWTFRKAAEVADQLRKIENGGDLKYMFGAPNTATERERWAKIARQQLDWHINQLTQRI